tara:strand:- start:209 stop:370 length:162 start_codon:yes stop_codon:yes gene_type:complete
MLKESSKNNKENTFPNTTNIVEEKICKDGFCSLPNQKEMSKHVTNDMNLFDPI